MYIRFTIVIVFSCTYIVLRYNVKFIKLYLMAEQKKTKYKTKLYKSNVIMQSISTFLEVMCGEK